MNKITVRHGFNCGYLSDGLKKFMREVKGHKILTSEEEISLFSRIQSGDSAAIEEIVLCNQSLVIDSAMQFGNRGLDMDDLISLGNIGMYKAIEKFKPGLSKFSTYALNWIKQEILRGIIENHTIRIPVSTVRKIRKVRKTLENAPLKTDVEIANELNLNRKQVRNFRLADTRTVAFDAPVGGDNGNSTIGSFLGKESDIEKNINIEHLKHIVEQLEERSKRIIIQRFGLNGETPKTLCQLAEQENVTHQCIRLWEQKALEELRKMVA